MTPEQTSLINQVKADWAQIGLSLLHSRGVVRHIPALLALIADQERRLGVAMGALEVYGALKVSRDDYGETGWVR